MSYDLCECRFSFLALWRHSHHMPQMGPIIRLGNGNLRTYRCAEQVHRLQVVASVGGRSYIDTEAFTSGKWKPTESSPAKDEYFK